jgi:hypothetical protein
MNTYLEKENFQSHPSHPKAHNSYIRGKETHQGGQSLGNIIPECSSSPKPRNHVKSHLLPGLPTNLRRQNQETMSKIIYCRDSLPIKNQETLAANDGVQDTNKC